MVISGHQGRQALSSSLSVATRGRPRSGGPTLWPSENLRASSLLWLIRSEGDRRGGGGGGGQTGRVSMFLRQTERCWRSLAARLRSRPGPCGELEEVEVEVEVR